MTGRTTKRDVGSLARWGVFVGIALALAAALWAGWSALGDRVALPGSTLRSATAVTVGLVHAPSTLDIRTATGADATALERALIGNVYETLIDVGDDGRLSPGVASAWRTSKDGRTLTLTLRSGLTFPDGDALDSADVVASLRAALDGGWPDAAAKLASLARVDAPDRTTVRLTLREPDATLPRTLSGRLGIVYDEHADVDYATGALGSGPFTVASWRNGVLQLKARDDGDARSRDVIVRYFADDDALAAAARKGEVDLAAPDDPTVAHRLADDDPDLFSVHAGASMRKVALLYDNDADSILSDVRARQSMRLMLDKAALANGRREQVAQVLGGPIGPLEPGYEDLTSVLPYDAAKGRAMLSYFGSSYVGTLRLVTPARFASLAQAIADQYAAQGVNVTVEALDDAGVAARAADRSFELMIAELDGTDGTAAFASPDSTAHYTNADAQSQYRAAVRATTDAAYADGLKTYARTVSEDAASDWLYAENAAVAVAKGVSGYPRAMADTRLPLAALVKK